MILPGKFKGTKGIGILIFIALSFNLGFSQDQTISDLLNYLEKSQLDLPDSHPDSRYNGIWFSEIKNRRHTFFFGSSDNSAQDANCFVTSMIHTLLAELYLKDNSLRSIPQMIEASVPAINSFRNGQSYNFFPLMDLNKELKSRGEGDLYPRGIRRASHYQYPKRFIQHGFNIYNDADDTALGLYSNFLYHKLYPKSDLAYPLYPDSISAFFGNYRDKPGSGTNLWNRIRGHGTKTGAYLTWLPEDQDSKTHTFFPKKGNFYIPYGVNDIDCVVNANVLGVLAALGARETSDMQMAADWIIEMIQLGKCRTCAVYYPSGANLEYAVVKACIRGASLLEPAILPILEKLLREQNSDGSWSDRMRGNEVLVTLHSINSLIGIKHFVDDEQIDKAVQSGLGYVMSKLHQQDGQAWLEGGIVFSAGSIFKRTHVWVSDAYTSALLLEALVCRGEY